MSGIKKAFFMSIVGVLLCVRDSNCADTKKATAQDSTLPTGLYTIVKTVNPKTGDPFYKASSELPTKENSTGQQSTQERPIFYIVVPQFSTKPTNSSDNLEAVFKFTQNTTVPVNFFENNLPASEITPTILFLDWEEMDSIPARTNAGKTLSDGINALRSQYTSARFILVGTGQGGNVINIASNNRMNPVYATIDIVIQLKPPIIENTQKNKSYISYVPNTTVIKKLFYFYSDQAFAVPSYNLKNPQYANTYPDTLHPNCTSFKLLINNKQATSDQMILPALGKRVLSLCNKAQNTYQLHPHLAANISTSDPKIDGAIIVLDSTTRNNKTIPAAQVAKERMQSKITSKQFEKNAGRQMATTLNPGEKERTTQLALVK